MSSKFEEIESDDTEIPEGLWYGDIAEWYQPKTDADVEVCDVLYEISSYFGSQGQEDVALDVEQLYSIYKIYKAVETNTWEECLEISQIAKDQDIEDYKRCQMIYEYSQQNNCDIEEAVTKVI